MPKQMLMIIWQTRLPNSDTFPYDEFLRIGFSHHVLILTKIKAFDERIFYIKKCAEEKLSFDALATKIAADEYHYQGTLSNNFLNSMPASEQALRATSTFKDEYLLDFINVEELNVRDIEDIDESEMMMTAEGEERDRAECIYIQLIHGLDECSDEDE